MKRFLYAGLALALLMLGGGLGFAAKTAATPDNPASQLTVDDCSPCTYASASTRTAVPASPEVAPGSEFASTTIALVQDTGGGETGTDESDATVKEFVDAVREVQMSWKEVGALAGLIALVTLLIRLTKLGFIAAAIRRNKVEWIRPLLAMLLAGFIGAGGALGTGASIPLGIGVGILAGLAAPGAHEFLESLFAMWNARTRSKLEAKSDAAAATS